MELGAGGGVSITFTHVCVCLKRREAIAKFASARRRMGRSIQRTPTEAGGKLRRVTPGTLNVLRPVPFFCKSCVGTGPPSPRGIHR